MTVSAVSAPTYTPLQSPQATKQDMSAFDALLDTINPLQHIPIVSDIFRSATGSSISPVAQIAGNTLYGGLLGGAITGLVSSVADVAVKGVSGKSMTEQVFSALTPQAPEAAPTPVTSNAAQEKKDAMQDQVNQTLLNMLHPGQNAAHVAGKYKKAQALDSTNQILLKAL